MIKVVVEAQGKVIVTDDHFQDKFEAIREAGALVGKLKYSAEACIYRDNLMVGWVNHCPPSKSRNNDEEEME